jgi:hypothetical protein
MRKVRLTIKVTSQSERAAYARDVDTRIATATRLKEGRDMIKSAYTIEMRLRISAAVLPCTWQMM